VPFNVDERLARRDSGGRSGRGGGLLGAGAHALTGGASREGELMVLRETCDAQPMISRGAKVVRSTVFILLTGLAFGVFALMGCGGAQEAAYAPANEGALEGARIPERIAEQLATCQPQDAAHLKAIRYTMSFKVFVTNEGQAVSAYVEESTL